MIKLFLGLVFLLMISFSNLSAHARHKSLSTKGATINGMLQEDSSKFFGSCVNCIEVLSDLVNAIANDENRFCTKTDCFFPAKSLTDYDLVIEDQFNWNKDKNLVIHTRGNIIFEGNGKIVSEKNGSIILKAGMEPGEKKEYKGTVKFEGDSTRIEMQGSGKVKIYYNPMKEEKKHKYHNPNHYFYDQRIKTGKYNNNLSAYMLVNSIYDLQDIKTFLSGDYALSQNIDAAETKHWFGGKGFKPLTNKDSRLEEGMPFSGDFDGNGYSISGLYINRPDEEEAGLFGGCYGWNAAHNKVENLILKDFDITGDSYVGSLAGSAVNSDISNVRVTNSKVKGKSIAGGLIGTITKANIENVHIAEPIEIAGREYVGFVTGGASRSNISIIFETEQELIEILKKYTLVGAQDKHTEIKTAFAHANLGETECASM